MSIGFNIETYQLNRQENLNNTGSGSNYDILNRIERLENNQLNIFNELDVDFQDNNYIDPYFTNAIITSNGIIPMQYKNRWYDDFTYDDTVDWDKSKNITFVSNTVKLADAATVSGEFYSLPISLGTNYAGFKFNANVDVPIKETLLGKEMFKANHLWFCQGTDNYDRVWLFRADTYKYESSPVLLTIYNTDMSIYKELTIPPANFFGSATNMGSYGYSPIHNTAKVIFSEENLCIVGFMMMNAAKNGVCFTNTLNDSNNINYEKHIVTFVDENGNAAVKYNYNNTGSVITSNYYYFGNSVTYNTRQYYGIPCKLSIQKNKILFITASCAKQFGSTAYAVYRIGRGIIAPTTGLLNDVNVTVNVGSSFGSYYESAGTTYNSWSGRYSTDAFKIGSFSYAFITDFVSYSYQLTLARMYLAEIKLSDAVGAATFDTDKGYSLVGTIDTQRLPYGHGGANGIYYSKKYNRLYLFSNSPSDNVLYITRFDVDWTTKNSTANTINLINSKTRNVTLSTTSCEGGTVYQYVNQKLKVFEDDNLLTFVFGSNNALIPSRRQITYMSMDFDLNIVQPETQMHINDGTPVENVVAFDMIINSNNKKLIYSRGNKDDFNDVTALANNLIYSDTVTNIASSIQFYYATDTDLTWKPINLGDQKTLSKPANDIRLRAILQSSSVYDSSPAIHAIEIESWDNDNQTARQSQYQSPRLVAMQNEGKAILIADQELNDGTIDWYVTFNGGISWTKTDLETEFVYNYTQSPDFRVKAVLSVTDNAAKLPIVHSYTLRTSHMVMHSDLEEIQINLMKTNFKIDTYTKASKNGLLKMTIDTFSSNSAVDVTNSDYNYYPLTGTVGGNYLKTKPETIQGGILTLLLTTDEVLDSTKPNSRILYEVSVDGGTTYKPITPNTKLQLNNTNTTVDTLVLKATFYDNAQLSAWGWAWD